MSLSNNFQYFLNNFKIYNSRAAVIWHNESYTYSQILEKIKNWQFNLNEIPEGSVVGLESDFSPKTIAILFTLISKNVIIVPLDNSQSEKNTKKIEIAEIDYLIKIDHFENVEILKCKNGGFKNLLYDRLIKSKTPGLVLFTSGSSGQPKAAFHDLTKLLLKFQIKRDSLLTINFLLFDHWGGLNTLFHILSNGGTVVFLENRNPDYVCELIDKWKVELLPTSPTFLNMMLLSRAYERHNLKSLKIITYGSEPMPESVLQKLNNHFPNIKLQQTYGLIELGVMSSKSKDNESLWVKIGGNGYQTRVVDGLLEIKSDSAMIGYLNAVSPYTDDGWFKTGDAVEVDGDYFKILGRKSELINVGGEKVYPQEVENLILTIDHVLDVQVYGEKHPFTGNIVCAKILFDDKCEIDFLKNEIKRTCKKMLESFKVPIKIYISNEKLYTNRFKKQRIS
uniref:ANL family adenylate-forming protein n=1 Tax=Flavobacterium sp. TaxID=239 RepID=UPI00404B0F9F